MKKILFLLVSALMITACGESNVPNGGGTEEVDPTKQGKLVVSLSAGSPIVIESKSSAKGSTTTDLSKFGLAIKDNDGKEIASYSSYTQMPGEMNLTAGTYSVSSKNDGVELGAAFEKPLYAGQATFAVSVGQTTSVSLVCELKSTGVKVTYSAEMLAMLKDIQVIVSTKSPASLEFNPQETRTAWYSVPADGDIYILVSAKKIGTDESFGQSRTLSGAKAKELRNVKLDVKTSGAAGVVITIDAKVVSKDVTIAIPDGDDILDNNGDNGSWEEDGGETPEPNPDPTPDPATGPVIRGASHEGQPFSLDDVILVDRSDETKVNELDVEISSAATGGIQNLLLTIESAPLHDLLVGLLGIDGQIDLANPPSGDDAPAWAAMFADELIGLIDPALPIKGKTSHLFSVGKLMGLLGTVDTTGGVEHKFHLSIVDANGTTNKTLIVKLVY